MARNPRKRTQEALFSPAPSTTPPDEEKAAERTETPEKPIPGFIADNIFGPGFNDPKPDADIPPAVPADEPRLNLPKIDPNGLIFDEYGIAGDCTNVPQILKAILCELVRRRV